MVPIVKGVRRFNKLTVSMGVLVLLVMLLAACGGSSGKVGLAGGVPVHVSKNDFRITSSIKPFTSGVRYHLVIRNNGHRVHEFIVSANPFIFNLAFSR